MAKRLQKTSFKKELRIPEKKLYPLDNNSIHNSPKIKLNSRPIEEKLTRKRKRKYSDNETLRNIKKRHYTKKLSSSETHDNNSIMGTTTRPSSSVVGSLSMSSSPVFGSTVSVRRPRPSQKNLSSSQLQQLPSHSFSFPTQSSNAHLNSNVFCLTSMAPKALSTTQITSFQESLPTLADNNNCRQQCESDEDYARQLQGQFDAEFQEWTSQEQRLNCESEAYIEHIRTQFEHDEQQQACHDNSRPILFEQPYFSEQLLMQNNNSSRSRRSRRQQTEQQHHAFTQQNDRRRYRSNGRNRVPPEILNNDGNDYEALLNLAERLGSVNHSKGLKRDVFNLLPCFLFNKATCAIGNENTCNICMSDYEDGETIKKLPCLHDYHSQCIEKWLKKKPTCPICRVEVRI